MIKVAKTFQISKNWKVFYEYLNLLIMEKSQIIKELKQYFRLEELVSRDVFKKWGEKSWNFLDEKALETLLVLRRDIIKAPMTINDWYWGGNNQQRGLRENTSAIVSNKTKSNSLYLSSHVFGKAFDVVSSKISATEMRKRINNLAYLLPYPIRIEDQSSAPTWLHFDMCVPYDYTRKITIFA